MAQVEENLTRLRAEQEAFHADVAASQGAAQDGQAEIEQLTNEVKVCTTNYENAKNSGSQSSNHIQ